jgi:hypothetical protein
MAQGIHSTPIVRRTVTAAVLWMLAVLPSLAQTHKVASAKAVVRAVGVYEWTGDMAKPVASRLIPVSLFIDGSNVAAHRQRVPAAEVGY